MEKDKNKLLMAYIPTGGFKVIKGLESAAMVFEKIMNKLLGEAMNMEVNPDAGNSTDGNKK
jgi:hypothetical protein